MKFFQDTWRGISRNRYICKLLLFFVLLNLLIELLATLPAEHVFTTFFANRLGGAELLQTGKYFLLAEFFHYMKFETRLVFLLLVVLNGLKAGVTFLLSSGVIHFLHQKRSGKWSEFRQKVREQFLVFFRLLLLCVGLAALGLILSLLFTGLFRPLWPAEKTEISVAYFFIFRLGFTLLLLSYLLMVADTWRVLLVRQNSRQLFAHFPQVFIFPLRFFPRLIAAYGLLLISLLAVLFSAQYLHPLTESENLLLSLGGFILLQVPVYLVYWLRFSRFGVLTELISNREAGA